MQFWINQHILTTNDSLKKIGLKADNLNSFSITQKKQLFTYYDNFSILCKRKNIEFPKESCNFILGSLSPSSRKMDTILLCIKF